jgi:2-methylisocitrate lyase-like PEP mutase family enzyme
VQAVAPKPVNVMMGHAAKLGFEVLAEIGVRRVSTASALSLAAWSGFVAAAEKLMRGEIDGLGDTVAMRSFANNFSAMAELCHRRAGSCSHFKTGCRNSRTATLAGTA